jgi:lipid II:glycine glycyltransferase (peptidoglycan interpeptide bridge formation enzyme)
MIAALVEEYVRRRRLTLRVIPSAFREDAFAPALSAVLSDAGMVAETAAPYRTLRVNLDAPMDSIRARLAHKWRNQLNAAERNGLELEEGSSMKLFAEFTSLYREMMVRKQFDTTVSVAAFQRIQERLPETQKMSLLIGRKDGRPLSGLVVSSVGTTGIYLLGATADDGMKAKGSYLLQWHVLRRLTERGCDCYDLGGINAESNPGVYHFKKGLGGDEVSQLGRYDRHSSRLNGMAIAVAERMTRFAGQAGVASRRGPAPP